MDKITDKIAALPADASYFSLEFFPPKTDMGFSNLRNRLDRMEKALRPLFVNVTWGAGGSTAQKSLQLAETCQRELGLTTCLHLTCTNMSPRLIDKTLEDAKALGIRNILALRGDPPRKAEYADANASTETQGDASTEFNYAIDLVRYIRKNHGDYFCIGVAAYPEGHADGSHPNDHSFDNDLPLLVEKVQAGADFIMTQLFFDVAAYSNFEAKLRAHPSGVFNTISVIPGLMPIQSYQMIKRTTKLSHAKMPQALMDRLNDVQADDEQVKSVGVDILSEIITEIKRLKSGTSSPQGFHFYTLNLEKSVSLILEKTGLIPDTDEDEEAVVADDHDVSAPMRANGLKPPSVTANTQASHTTARRLSSIGSDPRNRVIVSAGSVGNSEYVVSAQDASLLSKPINTRANTLAASEGEGILGREVTWDDFPNGRWGDARSPAYGEIDGYGVSLHMTPSQALQHWGYPVTVEDINSLFLRHIRGDLSALPWSEEELRPESSAIQRHLEALDMRGWWTVASQPAVNGVKSSDTTFGWGPANGFVFQKAFVEFFLPGSAWKVLLERLRDPAVKDQVCFYASNARGDFISSDRLDAGAADTDPATQVTATAWASDGPTPAEIGPSTNAVTWGVFPGKEIVTPTIIEEVSFSAWSEEAFGIWGEWARVYPPNSASAKLLEGIRHDYYLVNVTHHDFVEPNALWDLLLGQE
ncbi:methylenetetrahydrofolate reductase 1 [Ceratocystis pirilliformis]|uniref:Methylenetetrahydrofolate reductase 1 n=1 Tax=Ceratocystis pirilliformis TaxID=259994 RepID=A0ABR3Z1L1_9PEZI